jgi:hypothetical protein
LLLLLLAAAAVLWVFVVVVVCYVRAMLPQHVTAAVTAWTMSTCCQFGTWRSQHSDLAYMSYAGGELVVKAPSSATAAAAAAGSSSSSNFTYKWGAEDADVGFNWAAFYSDLEHEILPVTSGHR